MRLGECIPPTKSLEAIPRRKIKKGVLQLGLGLGFNCVMIGPAFLILVDTDSVFINAAAIRLTSNTLSSVYFCSCGTGLCSTVGFGQH